MSDLNSNTSPFVETDERGTAENVFASIVELIHSQNVEVVNFHFPFNNEEAIQAQVAIGEPSEEDGHVVVSTYGLGGVTTPARAKIDDVDKELRVELFGIAKNSEEARLLAKELAGLALYVYNTQTPLVPGVVVGQEGSAYYIISASPYGVLNGHGHKPVHTTPYLVSFFAVNRISNSEAKLLNEPGVSDKFVKFYENLGLDAYSLERPEFTGE